MVGDHQLGCLRLFFPQVCGERRQSKLGLQQHHEPLYLLHRLYIAVNEDGTPLESNAFLIPRWGGVLIYNVDIDQDQKPPIQESVNMQRLMSVFLTQFRLLLGLRDEEIAATRNLQVIAIKNGIGLRKWEADFLLRLRTIENLVYSRVTLQSLAHLLSQISNIVIKDEIGEQVHAAVDNLEKSAACLSSGLLAQALERSKVSFDASETAFFDPSLLEKLYFPEDQKYAIYIPLFLPVGIPVILSLRAIFKFMTAALSKSKTKTD